MNDNTGNEAVLPKGEPMEMPAPEISVQLDETESYEITRNYRVSAAMDGWLVAGPSEIADEIIDLLRSEQQLTRETRDKLADAFERGRGGNRPGIDDPNDVRPHLLVAGTGERGALSKAVLKRRKWFDAAEELERERIKGRKGAAVAIEIGSPYSLDYESMKKATAFYKRFILEFRDPNSDLMQRLDAAGLKKEDMSAIVIEDDPEYDNWKYAARSFFIEREAAAVCGVTFGQFGG